MPLSGQIIKQIQETLLAAFDRDDLRVLVRVSLEQNLDVITADEGLDIQVFELIQWAENNGQIEALLNGAAAQRPTNASLQTLAQTVALGDSAPAAGPPLFRTSSSPTRRSSQSALIIGTLTLLVVAVMVTVAYQVWSRGDQHPGPGVVASPSASVDPPTVITAPAAAAETRTPVVTVPATATKLPVRTATYTSTPDDTAPVPGAIPSPTRSPIRLDPTFSPGNP